MSADAFLSHWVIVLACHRQEPQDYHRCALSGTHLSDPLALRLIRSRTSAIRIRASSFCFVLQALSSLNALFKSNQEESGQLALFIGSPGVKEHRLRGGSRGGIQLPPYQS